MFEASCKEHDSNFIKWESIGQPSLLELFPGNALLSQNKLGNILTPLFVVLNKVMHRDKLDIVDWLRLTQFADQNETMSCVPLVQQDCQTTSKIPHIIASC